MNNFVKTIICVVAVAFMMFETSAALAVDFGANIIDNPGFESQSLTAWKQETRDAYTPSASIESEDDNYFVRLTADRLQDARRFYQDNKQFYKDQVYKVGMKVRGVRKDLNDSTIEYTTAVRIRDGNGTGSNNYFTEHVITNDDWQIIYDYMKFPSDSLCSIGIFARMAVKNCSYLYVDDVFVLPVDGISMYDFEDRDLNMPDTDVTVWECVGDVTTDIVSDGYKSDNSVYVAPSAGGIFRHYVSFTSETDYYISTMVKGQQGEMASLVLEYPDGTSEVLDSQTLSGEWQELFSFINPDTLSAQRGHLYVATENSEGQKTEYWLDRLKTIRTEDIQVDITAEFDYTHFKIQVESPDLPPIYTVSLCDTNDNILYTATYNPQSGFYEFEADTNQATGYFIIKVEFSDFISKTTDIFYYNAMLVEALNMLDAAPDDEVGDVLVKYAVAFGIDQSIYESLREEDIISKFNKYIASIDFSVDNSDLEQSLQKKSVLLSEEYNQAIETAYLFDCASPSDLKLFATQNRLYDVMAEDTYFNDIIDFDTFYTLMIQARQYGPEYSATEEDLVKRLYQNVTLIYGINNDDYRKIRDILQYYHDAEVVSIDFELYDALSNAKKGEVLEQLKQQQIKDISMIADSFTTLCDTAKKSSEIDKTYVPSGSSSGSYSGTSSGRGGFSGVTIANTSSTIPEDTSAATDDEKTDPEDTSAVTDEEKIDPSAQLPSISFIDVGHVEWAHQAISALEKSGVISGKEPGCFFPDHYVTREEAVKMIVLAFDMLQADSTENFHDVSLDSWYYSYVNAARYHKLTTGTGQNMFGVGENILRQDMAVILYNAYISITKTPLRDAQQLFRDYDDISRYAREAVAVLSTLNVIDGRGDGMFVPLDYVTRAEAAKMIYAITCL